MSVAVSAKRIVNTLYGLPNGVRETTLLAWYLKHMKQTL